MLDQMGRCTDDPPRFFDANWALHRRIAKLCGNVPVRGIYLTIIDFLQETVDDAQFPEFDRAAMLAVHRGLVARSDGGEGPRLDAAVAAHQPTHTRMTFKVLTVSVGWLSHPVTSPSVVLNFF